MRGRDWRGAREMGNKGLILGFLTQRKGFEVDNQSVVGYWT